jgi:hypothetical protein
MRKSSDCGRRDVDIIRDAIERGAERKSALLFESGGPLSGREVAKLLGISLEELKAKNYLLAVLMDNGEPGWPAFQFESHVMLSAVEKVCAAVNVDSGWARLSFFFLHLQELDGRTPVQAIREGSLCAVVLAASHFGEHGAS